MFLVIEGSLTLKPFSSSFIITWQPNLDVSVNPNAKSSMSFSSSSGSGILSYIASSSTITWHVEQAQEPPQAPLYLSSFSGLRGGDKYLPFQYHSPAKHLTGYRLSTL